MLEGKAGKKGFEMKDLGHLRYFLGIEIARPLKGIVISYRKYVLDLLTEIGMFGCHSIASPMDRNHKLCYESGDPIDK